MKILVVDDEPHLCKLYKEEFEDAGYEVITATTGEEAVRLFKTESPDLVTLDIAMPSTHDKEGLTILREMKEIKQDVPIILLTAFDFTADLQTWAADRYIVKSPNIQEIKKAISELLKAKELSAQA